MAGGAGRHRRPGWRGSQRPRRRGDPRRGRRRPQRRAGPRPPPSSPSTRTRAGRRSARDLPRCDRATSTRRWPRLRRSDASSPTPTGPAPRRSIARPASTARRRSSVPDRPQAHRDVGRRADRRAAWRRCDATSTPPTTCGRALRSASGGDRAGRRRPRPDHRSRSACPRRGDAPSGVIDGCGQRLRRWPSRPSSWPEPSCARPSSREPSWLPSCAGALAAFLAGAFLAASLLGGLLRVGRLLGWRLLRRRAFLAVPSSRLPSWPEPSWQRLLRRVFFAAAFLAGAFFAAVVFAVPSWQPSCRAVAAFLAAAFVAAVLAASPSSWPRRSGRGPGRSAAWQPRSGQLRQLLRPGDDRLQVSAGAELRHGGLLRLDALAGARVADPRASRTRFSNEPKPVMATFSPLATSRVMVSSTDSSACAAAFCCPRSGRRERRSADSCSQASLS